MILGCCVVFYSMSTVFLSLYKTSFTKYHLRQATSLPNFRVKAGIKNRNLQTILNMDKSIPVLVTFLEDHRYFYNWFCHVQDMSIDARMVVFTTDDFMESFDYIEGTSITLSIVFLKEEFKKENSSFLLDDTSISKRICQFILELLQQNNTVMFFRMESVWLQNPLMLILKRQIDLNDAIDLYSAGFTTRRSTIDTNFMYLKPSRNLIALWDKFMDQMNRYGASETKDPYAFLTQLLYRRYTGVLYELLPLRQIQDSAWYDSVILQQKHVRELHVIRLYNSRSGSSVALKTLENRGHWFLSENLTCDYFKVVNAEKSVWALEN